MKSVYNCFINYKEHLRTHPDATRAELLEFVKQKCDLYRRVEKETGVSEVFDNSNTRKQ